MMARCTSLRASGYCWELPTRSASRTRTVHPISGTAAGKWMHTVARACVDHRRCSFDTDCTRTPAHPPQHHLNAHGLSVSHNITRLRVVYHIKARQRFCSVHRRHSSWTMDAGVSKYASRTTSCWCKLPAQTAFQQSKPAVRYVVQLSNANAKRAWILHCRNGEQTLGVSSVCICAPTSNAVNVYSHVTTSV